MNTVDIVLRQFPGKTLIPLLEAGAAIGYAEQTCYNMAHRMTFPLPIRKVGRKSMVALTDLITYIEGQTVPFAATQSSNDAQATKVPGRVGRPTKAEQLRKLGKVA